MVLLLVGCWSLRDGRCPLLFVVRYSLFIVGFVYVACLIYVCCSVLVVCCILCVVCWYVCIFSVSLFVVRCLLFGSVMCSLLLLEYDALSVGWYVLLLCDMCLLLAVRCSLRVVRRSLLVVCLLICVRLLMLVSRCLLRTVFSIAVR